MIELVIFDLDGVLVDACEWHRIALNESLMQNCNYEISLEEHYKNYNGIPTKIKLKKLVEKGIIKEEQIQQIEKIKQEKTIEAINKYAFQRQEKIELLSFLKEKNIKIACYTNSIRNTAELMLQKTGILNFFDILVTNQDVQKSKPNPEGYLKILSELNISAKKALIVEDSPKGLEAAHLSGCKYVKVPNPDKVTKKFIENII